MKIKEFIKKENWTTGAMARDIYGHPVYTDDEDATCFCLLGMINICYPDLEDAFNVKIKIVENVPKLKDGTISGIGDWNDFVATFEDVKGLVEKLDI